MTASLLTRLVRRGSPLFLRDESSCGSYVLGEWYCRLLLVEQVFERRFSGLALLVNVMDPHFLLGFTALQVLIRHVILTFPCDLM